MAQIFVIAPAEDYFFSRKVAPDTLKAARVANLLAPEKVWSQSDPREQVIIADRLARGGQQG